MMHAFESQDIPRGASKPIMFGRTVTELEGRMIQCYSIVSSDIYCSDGNRADLNSTALAETQQSYGDDDNSHCQKLALKC